MESYLLGISLSSKVVRIACLRRKGNAFVLLRVSRFPLLSKDPASVESVVAGWTLQHIPQGSTVRAVFSLMDGTLFVKELAVPAGSNAEIHQAIKWELVTRHAEFPKDALIQWQRHDPSGKSRMVTALALKERDARYVAGLCAQNGWTLYAIEPANVSLSRVIPVPATPWLLVSVEGNQISTTLATGTTTRFVAIGDLRQTDQSIANNHINADSIDAALTHIRTTLKHWKTKTDKPVGEVILIGDGASGAALGRRIHDALGLAVRVPSLNPSLRVATGKAKPDTIHAYAHTIGAAVRAGSYTYGSEANFMTPDVKTRLLRDVAREQWGNAASLFTQLNGFFVFILVGLLALILYWTQTASYQTQQNKRFIQNHPGQALRAEVAKTNALLQSVDTLLASQADTGARLAFFAGNTPRILTFTSVKLTNMAKQEWAVEGRGSRTAILAFYYRLKAQAGDASVRMVYSSLEKENDADFRIIVVW